MKFKKFKNANSKFKDKKSKNRNQKTKRMKHKKSMKKYRGGGGLVVAAGKVAQSAQTVAASALDLTGSLARTSGVIMTKSGEAVEIAGEGMGDLIKESATVSFEVLNNSVKFAGHVNHGLFGTLKLIYKTGSLVGLILDKIIEGSASLFVARLTEIDELTAVYMGNNVGYNRKRIYPDYLLKTYNETRHQYYKIYLNTKKLLKSHKQTALSHLLQLKCSKWFGQVSCRKVEKLFDTSKINELKNGLYADKLFMELKKQPVEMDQKYREYIRELGQNYIEASRSLSSATGTEEEKNDYLKTIVLNFMDKYNMSSKKKDVVRNGRKITIETDEIFTKVFKVYT